MRWRGLPQSTNVEDRRRLGPRMAVGGGLGSVLLLVVYLIFGGDPRALLEDPGPAGETGVVQTGDRREDELAQLVSAVLGDTERVWSDLFRRNGRDYREPRLVLFRGQVQSACGFAGAAVGPFYCPADRQVYIDLSFYRELSQRFGAPGDFAQAYVIAHEIGHHVQNELGISDRVHRMRGRVSQKEYNDLSVRLELQADFFAGVWAHHAEKARQILETGDIEEGLRAAAAIGDDRLQKQSRGYVVPDSFTHGSSEQRVRWFRKGLETGNPEAGDTFAVDRP